MAAATRSVLFPLPNMLLEIREAAGVAAADGDRASGLDGIRLVCDDVDEVARRLNKASRSLQPSEDRKVEVVGAGDPRTWTSTFVDPVASRTIPVELISGESGSRPKGAEGSFDPKSVIRGLDHVVVMSADVEATRDFYGEGLGIRLALDRSFEERGVRLLFFRVGGVTIEIGGRLDAEQDPNARDRFGGLAWQVGDIDAIHSRLSADRFDISEIRDGNKPGTRVCTVRDPVHGVPTLLIE